MASNRNFGLDVEIYGRLAVPDAIRGVARRADEAGFESIWLADHVGVPTAFGSPHPGSFPTDPADREPKRSRLDERMPGTGTPRRVIDDIKARLDLGVGTVIVRHYADPPAELDAQLARFADDIVPQV